MRASELLDEDELVDIEGRYPKGISSREIVDLFASRVCASRKRPCASTCSSVSCRDRCGWAARASTAGLAACTRPAWSGGVNQVKSMMARNLTIEDIQRSFVQFKEEIEGVSKGLRDLIASFEREAKGPALSPQRRQEIEREIEAAKHAAGELVRRISDLEASFFLAGRDGGSGTAAGGGSDLY